MFKSKSSIVWGLIRRCAERKDIDTLVGLVRSYHPIFIERGGSIAHLFVDLSARSEGGRSNFIIRHMKKIRPSDIFNGHFDASAVCA
jgi:hypothetical protein